ncbi:MAG: hypothetical protein HQL23_02090 [Candidatus Omnitrophica bacterium]|nr:hypothetical protein [Candidatus Omnitrophota bacterium]
MPPDTSTPNPLRDIQHKYSALQLYLISGLCAVILGIIGYLWLREAKTYQSYANPSYGFALKYPSDWAVTENKDNTAVIFNSPRKNALDAFSENVNVVIQGVDPRLSLEVYSDRAVKQLQAVFKAKIEIIDQEPFTLAGFPAAKFTYIARDPIYDLKITHVWALKNGKAYQITYVATLADYDLYIKSVNALFRSFKLL